MFLYERIIGIFTYIFLMSIMIFLIYKSDKSKLTKYLRIYLVILVVLAFIYIPATSADLYRYIISAHYFNSITSSKLLKLLINSSSPMQVIYFYILGKFNIDGLIAAASTLIYYGSFFKIIEGVAKKYNLSNKSVALSLLFIMSMGEFAMVINIIRSSVAFSIIALCIYREIIENKSFVSNIFLYLFSGMMHLSAIGLILIRVILLLLFKEKSNLRKIINITLLVFIAFITYKFGRNYIESMIDKADYYTNNKVYNYIWEYIISFIYMLFSTVVLILLKKKKTDNFEINQLINFNLIINLVVFIFLYEYSIFTRFQMFSTIIFTPLFSYYIELLNRNNKKRKFLIFIYLCVVISFIILACTRGNLCGYKYLNFN